METMPCVGDNVLWNLITYHTGGWESRNVCLTICVFANACVCLRKRKQRETRTKDQATLTPFASCSFSTITKITWHSNNVASETVFKNKKLQENGAVVAVKSAGTYGGK